MASERKWFAVSQAFTANGALNGKITVSDVAGFYVKSKVRVVSDTQDPQVLEIKRIEGTTGIYVGRTGENIDDRVSMVAFTTADNASVTLFEQTIPTIKQEDIWQAIYDREPVVALRSALVDKYGQKIDSVRDNSGINRLAVDGQFHAEVDVQVDVDVDGYYDPVTNPDPDNIGLIGHTRSIGTNQTHQVQRQTAKRGTADTDTVSADVSIHDHQGNEYTPLNPVPISSSYEKFIPMINGSNWMKLANYDQITPTFAGNNVTFAYKEDGAIIGEAVVTNYTSQTAWDLQLNRYINDDDGSHLLDDDDTPLNLD